MKLADMSYRGLNLATNLPRLSEIVFAALRIISVTWDWRS